MNLSDISIRVLTPETDLTAFKCAEGDLNEFLLDESKDYQTEFLAVTYLLVNSENNDIVAYYSLLNDVVRLNETEKSVRNRIYERNKFRFFTDKDKDDDTRLMYFDLKDFG